MSYGNHQDINDKVDQLVNVQIFLVIVNIFYIVVLTSVAQRISFQHCQHNWIESSGLVIPILENTLVISNPDYNYI